MSRSEESPEGIGGLVSEISTNGENLEHSHLRNFSVRRNEMLHKVRSNEGASFEEISVPKFPRYASQRKNYARNGCFAKQNTRRPDSTSTLSWFASDQIPRLGLFPFREISSKPSISISEDITYKNNHYHDVTKLEEFGTTYFPEKYVTSTHFQVSLSRLSIVGLLGPETPIPIVEEIALAHGIQIKPDQLTDDRYYHEMIRKISTTPVHVVSEPFSYQDYILIATFINPYMDVQYWPEITSRNNRPTSYPFNQTAENVSLYSSLIRYMGFRSKSNFERLPANFTLGPITPDSPNNIDACILFRYCLLRGLMVNRFTTIQEMEVLVRMDRQGDNFFIQQQIQIALSSNNLSRRSLINALHTLIGPSISNIASGNSSRPGLVESTKDPLIPISTSLPNETQIPVRNPIHRLGEPLMANPDKSTRCASSGEKQLVKGLKEPPLKSSLDRISRKSTREPVRLPIILPDRDQSVQKSIERQEEEVLTGLLKEMKEVEDRSFLTEPNRLLGNLPDLPGERSSRESHNRSKRVRQPRRRKRNLPRRNANHRNTHRNLLRKINTSVQLPSDKVDRQSKVHKNSALGISGAPNSNSSRSDTRPDPRSDTRSDRNRRNKSKNESAKQLPSGNEFILVDDQLDRPNTPSIEKNNLEQIRAKRDFSDQSLNKRSSRQTRHSLLNKKSQNERSPDQEKSVPIVPLFELNQTEQLSVEYSSEETLTRINQMIADMVNQRTNVSRMTGQIVNPLENEREINESIHRTLRFLPPDNQIHVIILAAVLYQIDLSKCKNPSLEFEALWNYGGNIEDYLPLDDNLRRRMSPDRLRIDGPIISIVFNPQFPRALYNEQTLRSMALSYGHTEEEIAVDDPYYLLQMAIFIDHFYPGKPTNFLNSTTPIELDSIDQLNSWEYISFGNLDKGFNIIKYTELNDLFRQYGYFKYPKVHPDDPEVYSRQAIDRLSILLLRLSYLEEPSDHINMRHHLALKINEIILEDSDILLAERYLRDKYREDANNQRIIDQLLHKFLDLTMKMRGWPGGDTPYPIIKTPVDNPYEVEIRVTDAIGEFDRFCGNHPECSDLFMKYPLFEYRGGYIRSKAIDDGFTIQDRLNIVKSFNSITSCIRLTSNWFGATYSKILKVLGKDQVFDIKQLRSIG